MQTDKSPLYGVRRAHKTVRGPIPLNGNHRALIRKLAEMAVADLTDEAEEEVPTK